MQTSARPRLLRLYQLQGGRCAYCRCQTTLPSVLPPIVGPYTATVDHREPVARGGGNGRDNIVMACNTCNHRKGSMPWKAWTAFMRSNPQLFDATAVAVAGADATACDEGELANIEWPWLRDLIRDRVRQVGFGPWK